MGSPRFSLKRSLLLSGVAVLAVLTTGAMAQDQSSSSTSSQQSSTTTQSSSSTSAASSSSASSSSSQTMPPLSQSSSVSLPALSSPTAKMPTLSKTVDNSYPTYPPPSPPPTQDAPFMNRSTLPDGTVFIAVGAILAAFGLAVLLWRAIIGCLLHRSVERAAQAQHRANDKAATFPAPPPPFYKYTDRDSSPSLATGPAPGQGKRRTNRGPIPSSTPSQSNLFFSPTAAPSATGSMSAAGNRDSRFLPSGFYAATTASPVAGHGHSISLSNLRPASRGLAQQGVSPPESPNMGPRTGNTPVPRNFSTSSVNLNRPPSGRAPSAYLDDLLDEQGHQFPPPGGYNAPGHHGGPHAPGHTYSNSQGRY